MPCNDICWAVAHPDAPSAVATRCRSLGDSARHCAPRIPVEVCDEDNEDVM